MDDKWWVYATEEVQVIDGNYYIESFNDESIIFRSVEIPVEYVSIDDEQQC